MTFHERSMTELGQLFVNLSAAVTQDGIPAALESIRATFGAEAALLSATCRNRSRPPLWELATECGSSLDLASLVGASGTINEPRGCRSATANFVDPQSTMRYGLRLFRPAPGAEFDSDEQALLNLLLSQLANSVTARAQRAHAETERALYSDLLGRLQVGVIVLDGAGRVLSASGQAGQVLDARDGLQLVNGRLCASNATEDKRLQAILRAVLARPFETETGNGQGLSLTKRGTSRKLGVIVRRIQDGGADRPTVSIHLRDADTAPDVEPNVMRQIFDLTPAEAAVARRLTDGLSLEDTAVALDISRNTARAHLRSIFSKSGIKRQTELVRLVLNSAVVL